MSAKMWLCHCSVHWDISTDPTNPTVFHVVGKLHVDAGDSLFDIISWDTKVAGIDGAMTYAGQATGFLKDDVFQGTAEARYEMRFPLMPELRIFQTGIGVFKFHVTR